MENLNNKKENVNEEKARERITKKDLFLILFVILFLSGATFWNFKNWGKSLEKVELPKFEMPKLEFSPQKTEGYKEFISPDGKLKMSYPSDWTVMDNQFLESSQSQVTMKGKVLFIAQKFSWNTAGLAILSVQELNFEPEKRTEEILETLKEESKQKEGEMEILKSEIEDREVFFEAKYKRGANLDLHSEEKVIITEGKTYLVSFFTSKKDWAAFQKEGEDILNTVQLLE